MHILLRWGGGGCHGDMSSSHVARLRIAASCCKLVYNGDCSCPCVHVGVCACENQP